MASRKTRTEAREAGVGAGLEQHLTKYLIGVVTRLTLLSNAQRMTPCSMSRTPTVNPCARSSKACFSARTTLLQTKFQTILCQVHKDKVPVLCTSAPINLTSCRLTGHCTEQPSRRCGMTTAQYRTWWEEAWPCDHSGTPMTCLLAHSGCEMLGWDVQSAEDVFV